MPHYHVMCIARTRAPADALASLMKTAATAVVKSGGVVRRIQHHGVRPLAFAVHRRFEADTERDFEGRFFTVQMDGQPRLMLLVRDMMFESRLFWRVMPLKQKDPDVRNWRSLRKIYNEERKVLSDEYERVINTERHKLKKLFEELL